LTSLKAIDRIREEVYMVCP